MKRADESRSSKIDRLLSWQADEDEVHRADEGWSSTIDKLLGWQASEDEMHMTYEMNIPSESNFIRYSSNIHMVRVLLVPKRQNCDGLDPM